MAEKSQIIDAIEALAVHCRPPLMTIDQRALWMKDWGADLAEFPLEAIQQACRKWRFSGSTKFPTAGQLLPLIRESLPKPQAEAVRPWRPATEDEYRAMSVRDKIREHQILAHSAYSKCGPMFRNTTTSGAPLTKASGKHLTPEDMPPAFHHWKAEGDRHSQEVYRLRQIVNGARLAAE